MGTVAYTVRARQTFGSQQVVTGKFISPQGEQTEVGSFPINMVLSPDGKYIIATNVGYREQLSVLDAATGALISRRQYEVQNDGPDRGLYFGLAVRKDGDRTLVYASQGAQDLVSVLELTENGRLRPIAHLSDRRTEANPLPHHVAGLALSGDGQTLYAVNNESDKQSKWMGSVSILDLNAPANTGPNREIKVPAFPYAVVAVTEGPSAGTRLYATCERDGFVASIDLVSGQTTNVRVGDGPTSLLLNPDQSRLYVTNSLSDTLSLIDTRTNRVTDTILLRQGDLSGIPGASPLGMALAPDGKRLFIAMADMNAVAVVDTDSKRTLGLIDVGWYPTSVAVSADGRRLFVANGMGVHSRIPNDAPVRDWGQYTENIIEGTVSVLDVRKCLDGLAASTDRVLINNLSKDQVAADAARSFRHPKINHVIYVIKENRTYDQVFGDIAKGNGDAKICEFPRAVTPNQHALAERFGLLDNFYVCAQMSEEGWTWSTAGILNPYGERNFSLNYSGRGRSYDAEGENNNTPVDLEGMRDMAAGENGYLWDQAERQHVSMRNYGFFVEADLESRTASGVADRTEAEAPTNKVLIGKTCLDFRQFDTSYADSDAWVKLGLKPFPRQRVKYGSHADPSRISAFHREWDDYVKNGNLPRLVMMRLPRNHTAGTQPGISTPEACVADNDYAVGELVDWVSHSPYWKSTMICVLEDDSQAGFDHVDCHRSPALVISPYCKPHGLDSRFYNTDSMLRTMELALGLRPLCQYDAVAAPIDVFGPKAANEAPYDAIMPDAKILGAVNTRRAYRSSDSARMVSLYREDSAPDVELNDILWGAIKGPHTPRPHTRGAIWHKADLD